MRRFQSDVATTAGEGRKTGETSSAAAAAVQIIKRLITVRSEISETGTCLLRTGGRVGSRVSAVIS
ncbi:hypothetical protein ABIA23_005925 [Sinorhizobium fredii]